MACKTFSLINYLTHSSPFLQKFPSSSSFKLIHYSNDSNSNFKGLNSTTISTNNFTWDDVIQIGNSDSDPSNLSGFFDKVSACNRNLEKLSEFVPFVVEEQVVGYVHNRFAAHLRRFQDVFSFPQDILHNVNFDWHITLRPTLQSPEDRTSAVANVIKCLGEELIPGIRNELYPVTPCFGTQALFSLERAAAPYFGIKAYGVHMNGYVETKSQKFLWLGKRSLAKSTFPGMLDHLVAGGLPHGIPCGENMMKECEEEAGIPISISKKVEPVGAVSYMDINGDRLKRDVLFCYDLKLPEDFVPCNHDGEVESFRLIPVSHVANVIKKTQYFKSNCTLVIIDFLFRHGYEFYLYDSQNY
ncbi:Nudix hydrolase 20 chloroplastic [Bienertia sinuspersici]